MFTIKLDDCHPFFHSQHQSKLKRAVNAVIFMNHVVPHNGPVHLEGQSVAKVSVILDNLTSYFHSQLVNSSHPLHSSPFVH